MSSVQKGVASFQNSQLQMFLVPQSRLKQFVEREGVLSVLHRWGPGLTHRHPDLVQGFPGSRPGSLGAGRHDGRVRALATRGDVGQAAGLHPEPSWQGLVLAADHSLFAFHVSWGRSSMLCRTAGSWCVHPPTVRPTLCACGFTRAGRCVQAPWSA